MVVTFTFTFVTVVYVTLGYIYVGCGLVYVTFTFVTRLPRFPVTFTVWFGYVYVYVYVCYLLRSVVGYFTFVTHTVVYGCLLVGSTLRLVVCYVGSVVDLIYVALRLFGC